MSDHPVAAGPSNDEILECVREVKRITREKDEVVGRLRSSRKRAKGQGVNMKALDALLAASRQDSDVVVADIRDTVRYLSLGRIEVTPATLFGDWQPVVTERTRMADDIWDAEDAGYRAGRHGVDIAECPYDPGSELQVAWLSWHQKGQAAIAAEMGPDAAQAPASRVRPVRQTRIPGTEHRMRAPDAGNGHAAAPKKKRGRPPGRGSRHAALTHEAPAPIN